MLQSARNSHQKSPGREPSAALRFATNVLRPLVRTFMRLGFSATEINELVRWLFVDEFYNQKEFWHRRKPFAARGALLSGLSRKEVNRLSKISQPDKAILTDQQNRAARVLAGWVNDKRFQDAEGKPAVLPLEGKSRIASFASLVLLYSGDVTLRTVLDELVRTGCVKVEDGNVRLLSHTYGTMQDMPDEHLTASGFGLQRIGETIDFNVANVKSSDRRLQRVWRQKLIPVEKAAEAKQLLTEHSVALGRQLDEKLSRLAHAKPRFGQEYREIGIGMYYYEDEGENS